MSVGQRLKLARKTRKVSGEVLGSYIGVTKGQISNIESGSANLTKANAIVLADKLKINHDWLLTGEGLSGLENVLPVVPATNNISSNSNYNEANPTNKISFGAQTTPETRSSTVEIELLRSRILDLEMERNDLREKVKSLESKQSELYEKLLKSLEK